MKVIRAIMSLEFYSLAARARDGRARARLCSFMFTAARVDRCVGAGLRVWRGLTAARRITGDAFDKVPRAPLIVA